MQRSLTSLELTELPHVSAVVSSTANNVDTYPNAPKPDEDNKNVTDGTDSNNMRLSENSQHKNSRDPARDLSIQVLEKFSMVTKFARETKAHLFGESRLLGNSEMDLDRAPNRSREDNTSFGRTSSLPPDSIPVQESSLQPGQIAAENSREVGSLAYIFDNVILMNEVFLL
jgi:hypothetical protein